MKKLLFITLLFALGAVSTGADAADTGDSTTIRNNTSVPIEILLPSQKTVAGEFEGGAFLTIPADDYAILSRDDLGRVSQTPNRWAAESGRFYNDIGFKTPTGDVFTVHYLPPGKRKYSRHDVEGYPKEVVLTEKRVVTYEATPRY